MISRNAGFGCGGKGWHAEGTVLTCNQPPPGITENIHYTVAKQFAESYLDKADFFRGVLS